MGIMVIFRIMGKAGFISSTVGSISLVAQYPTVKLCGFLRFSSNLQVYLYGRVRTSTGAVGVSATRSSDALVVRNHLGSGRVSVILVKCRGLNNQRRVLGFYIL